MKSVRLYYTKTGRMKFVSHLDMTRFMIRAIMRAKLPVWRTEGFNPHPYVTFALPLSLGFESSYEIMEIRLTDDGFDISKLPEMLNSVCPEHLRFFAAKDPVKKMKLVSFASFTVTFNDGGKVQNALSGFLQKASIVTEKTTKKGGTKQIDLKPLISDAEVLLKGTDTVLKITLPAGPVTNINPELLISAFFAENGNECFYSVMRDAVLDDEKNLFE